MKINKNILKIFAALMSLAVLITICPLGAFAATNTAQGFDKDKTYLCGVYDDKGLFTESELEELDELVRETSEELELYICIYLSDIARGENSTNKFADEAYDELFGKDTDGVFYYMDLSEQYSPYDYISTAGKGMLLYDDHIDSMLNTIFNDLPASGEPIVDYEISTGINTICRVLKSYGSDEPSLFDYQYDSYTDKYIYMKDGKTVVSTSPPLAIKLRNGTISLIIGAAIALIIFFTAKSHYKFKVSYNPRSYVSRKDSHFKRKEDLFIRAYTTKVRIESSSGGGGGGGGGHGGGGGSHGGGGGHR